MRIEKSIEIKAAPEKIWPIHWWDRVPEWNDTVKEAKWTSEKRHGVGATAHVVSQANGWKAEYDVEITEIVENKKRAWRTISGDLSGFGWTTFEPTETGTRVTVMTDIKMPISARIMDKLSGISRRAEKSQERALEKLKEIVEKE